MKHFDKSAALHALTCCMLAAAMVCFSLAAGAQTKTMTCIVADGQYVNVRNRASSGAATWGVMHAGETIEIDPSEITDGFFRTTFRDRTAYVSVRYFEIPDDAHYIVRANGRVRLRKTPGGAADGFVRPGDRVYVMAWRYAADGSLWARCTGGQYICADYLEKEETPK